LLTRWLTPEPPAPAWRHIHNEMLPRTEGRRSQENLLSVYTHFMQAFLGHHVNISDVESNVEGFFQAAWARMVRVYGWGCEKSPACTTKTVYNWLLQQPEKFQMLKNSKVVTSITFAADAASSLREQRDRARRSDDLLESGPPVQSVAVVERHVPPAACVPQNALLYPSSAPRPPPPLRKGAPIRVQDDTFKTYLEQNAPKPGARPCWSCPFCFTSRHFHILENLRRHVRTVHDDASEEERELVSSQSDIVCLVWCTTRGLATSQSKWEPILQ
jgi:hypothetical protein